MSYHKQFFNNLDCGTENQFLYCKQEIPGSDLVADTDAQHHTNQGFYLCLLHIVTEEKRIFDELCFRVPER